MRFRDWYTRCFRFHYCVNCPDPVCMAEVRAYEKHGYIGWLLWRLGFGPAEWSGHAR